MKAQDPFVSIALAIAAVVLVFAAAAGQYLVWPARRPVGEPPAELRAQAVSFDCGDGVHRISGWLACGDADKGVILLLHEMRADRRSMLARARFLAGRGHGLLMIDLPGHGQSDGASITLGHRESMAAGAALDYLHAMFPDRPIGVIGVSLGGAALLLASRRRAPDAVVLESVYPTLKQAAMNRLRVNCGWFAPWVAPLMFAQLPLRYGITHRRLRPIDTIAAIGAPVLVLGGGLDRETPAAETRALYEAAAMPKQLWLIEQAQHEDLHRFAGAEYERRVGAFFARHLRRRRSGADQAIAIVATVQPTEKIGIGL